MMSDAEKREIMESIKSLKEEIKRLESMLEVSEEDEKKKDDVSKELKEKEEKLKEALNKEIEKFNTVSTKIASNLQMVKTRLTLEVDVDSINVTEALNGLTIELRDFESEANVLASDIEDFKKEVSADELKLTPREIKRKVRQFKERLKSLKQEQIRRYNVRVELTNMLIEEYKSKVLAGTEAYDIAYGIDTMSLCVATVSEWRHNSYLSELNYNKLIEINNKFKLIDEKIKENELTAEKGISDLKVQIDYANEKILDLETDLSLGFDRASLKNANVRLVELSELLISLGTELEKYKDDMKPEEYEEYRTKHSDLMKSYLAVQKKIRVSEKVFEDKDVMDYDYFSTKLAGLETDVLDFEFLVSSLYGNVLSNSLSVFENKYTTINNKVVDYKEQLEEAYKQQLLDDNQYKNLTTKLNMLSGTLEHTNSLLKEPKMYGMEKTTDIYDFLNGTIDGVEKTIEGLEIALVHLEKPIRSRESRKYFDSVMKKLENEIKNLEKQLEMYKEQDEEKYNATKERLVNAKKRMNALGKNYRRKCPFLVRAVKSAKHFFKRYKKQLLVIAGLTAFAMIAHSVIIPAIMHGNIMIGCYSPALRGPVKTINNLLGGLIGATTDARGFCYLANGVRLNAYAATSSLLKGLAISGIGSAALVAPVIVAVKKLIEKINMAELKQKLMEGKDKVVETTKKTVTATKEKMAESKEKRQNKSAGSKARRDINKEIKALFSDFEKSGLSADQYCEQNGIQGFYVELLETYEQDKLMQRQNRRKGGK